MSYPLLVPSTLVKPQTRDGRFHWWRVIEDPGPASNPKRIVVLARTEPERSDQRIRVRRDRLHVYDPARGLSIYDVQPTVVQKEPRVVRKEPPAARADMPELPDILRRV